MNYQLPTNNLKNKYFICKHQNNTVNYFNCMNCCITNKLSCWKEHIKNQIELDCLTKNAFNYLLRDLTICPICEEIYEEVFTDNDFNVGLICNNCKNSSILNIQNMKNTLSDRFEEIDYNELHTIIDKSLNDEI